MFLALDIGNTTIAAGLFKRAEKKKAVCGNDGFKERIEGPEILFRTESSRAITAGGYASSLAESLSGAGVDPMEIDGAVISSVVPAVEDEVVKSVEKLTGIKPLLLADGETAGRHAGVPVLTDNPAEVGADRIVNAVAAYELYGGPVVVVDFGTAVTVDYVDGEGRYVGGAIAPGISLSAEALIAKAARLQGVDVEKPLKAIGRNTAEALKSGFYHGFSGLVDRIVEKITEEVMPPVKVVATGGAAGVISGGSSSVTCVDESLTLKGLWIIYMKGKKANDF